MITSDKNPKIQFIRSLIEHAKERRESAAFVVEGVRLLEEALQAGVNLSLVLQSSNLSERGQALVNLVSSQGTSVEEIPIQLMAKLADTSTPQGILAVAKQPPDKMPQSLDFALICDSIRDPGNLGTILRSAKAAGVQAVFLSPGTTDPYAPKVLRAGMGAHFHLTIMRTEWGQIESICQQHHLRIYLASAEAKTPYWKADLRLPHAILIGGEAEGAGSQASSIAQIPLSIPMPGQSESLNAAIAASILLFETVRQRSQ